jgi:soluble lytic murein transglycosylase-like protein
MNLKLLRAEWRVVRRAALRLTSQSLSLVGLLAVGGVVVVASHPDYAHAVGRWIVPQAEPAAAPQSALPEALSGAIANPGSEASRMLGLNADAPATSSATSSMASNEPAVASSKVAVDERVGTPREKREVTNYLSKKYRVNSDAIAMLVDAAYVTGKDLNLDPLLLLSVMGIESGFNPFAESTAGASGLMQLMSKVHRDKLADFGGPNIALNPVVNLRVGAVVLKDCIRRGGSIADGLRLYVGAGMGDDSGYGSRVLQEKDRLAQAVRGNARPRIEPIQATAPRSHPTDAERIEKAAEAKPDTQALERATDPDHGRFASL